MMQMCGTLKASWHYFLKEDPRSLPGLYKRSVLLYIWCKLVNVLMLNAYGGRNVTFSKLRFNITMVSSNMDSSNQRK